MAIANVKLSKVYNVSEIMKECSMNVKVKVTGEKWYKVKYNCFLFFFKIAVFFLGCKNFVEIEVVEKGA